MEISIFPFQPLFFVALSYGNTVVFPYVVGSLFHTLLEVRGNIVTDDSGKPYSLSPAVRK